VCYLSLEMSKVHIPERSESSSLINIIYLIFFLSNSFVWYLYSVNGTVPFSTDLL